MHMIYIIMAVRYNELMQKHTCMQEDRERQHTDQETGFEMTELGADL